MCWRVCRLEAERRRELATWRLAAQNACVPGGAVLSFARLAQTLLGERAELLDRIAFGAQHIQRAAVSRVAQLCRGGRELGAALRGLRRRLLARPVARRPVHVLREPVVAELLVREKERQEEAEAERQQPDVASALRALQPADVPATGANEKPRWGHRHMLLSLSSTLRPGLAAAAH